MMAAFLGAMFGALVASGAAYTYVRHVFIPETQAWFESMGIVTTVRGRSIDAPIAIPPPVMPEIDGIPCTVSMAVLDIRRTCSCWMCKALVGYEDHIAEHAR